MYFFPCPCSGDRCMIMVHTKSNLISYIQWETSWLREYQESAKLSSRQRWLLCLTLFGFLHDSMCYFIVLMSSLLFYNVENSKNKEILEWVGVSKLLTGTVHIGIILPISFTHLQKLHCMHTTDVLTIKPEWFIPIKNNKKRVLFFQQ
jgi:hypothetical protein